MRFFYLLTCLTFFCTTANAEAIVVTDQNHPVYNIPQNTKVIELDAVQHLQETLSTSLPKDQTQAEQMARELLEQSGGQVHLSMQAALQGVVDAWVLGVAKIPAVIVDQKYVVYGEPDVSAALSTIKTYQEANQ